MKLSNYKRIAVIMVVVIIASIFIFQFQNFENVYDNNQNNSDNYYPELDSYSIIEEETVNQNENLQLLKSSNTFLFSLYKSCILNNIRDFDKAIKLKYNVIINAILICNYSVFVVFFSNKKDGKKRMQFVFS